MNLSKNIKNLDYSKFYYTQSTLNHTPHMTPTPERRFNAIQIQRTYTPKKISIESIKFYRKNNNTIKRKTKFSCVSKNKEFFELGLIFCQCQANLILFFSKNNAIDTCIFSV